MPSQGPIYIETCQTKVRPLRKILNSRQINAKSETEDQKMCHVFDRVRYGGQAWYFGWNGKSDNVK